MERTMLWLTRLVWVVVALVGGAALEAAVDGRSSGVRWVVGVGAWSAWAIVALALAVPSVSSLTASRIIAPLAPLAAVAAAFAGAPAVDSLLLGVPGVVAVAALLTPDIARVDVQASAYGDEERFPLRPPAAAGIAAVVSWALWASCALAGPLLLAAASWIAGVVVTALAIGGTAFLVPRWHRLAHRWLVLVPAGLVVRDPVVLAETLMLRSDHIATVALAPADTRAADLTGPASGYAVEVTTNRTVTAVFAPTPSHPEGRAIHLTAFLVSPSRPGRALVAAAARGLPVT